MTQAHQFGDLPNGTKHNFKTDDCPVLPDTLVRVRFAGLNFDTQGKLPIHSVGRANEFCWRRDGINKHVVVEYEVLP